MSAVWDVLAGLLTVAGALFALFAAIGVVRLPDVYTRMHAASKSGAVACGFMFLALAVTAQDIAVVGRALAGFLFLLLTTPISAHLLARAAYITGVRPWSGTRVDEIGDPERLKGEPP